MKSLQEDFKSTDSESIHTPSRFNGKLGEVTKAVAIASALIVLRPQETQAQTLPLPVYACFTNLVGAAVCTVIGAATAYGTYETQKAISGGYMTRGGQLIGDREIYQSYTAPYAPDKRYSCRFEKMNSYGGRKEYSIEVIAKSQPGACYKGKMSYPDSIYSECGEYEGPGNRIMHSCVGS